MMRGRGHGWVAQVEGEVSPRRCERVGADVEIADRAGPSTGGVDGETARETEDVEDVGAGREIPDADAVVALVEEESGLLAADDVGFEQESLLTEEDGGGIVGSAEVLAAAAGGGGFERGEVPAEAEDDPFGLEQFLE